MKCHKIMKRVFAVSLAASVLATAAGCGKKGGVKT